MAETAVGFVIDQLIQFSTQEANLLRGVHGQVSDIKLELESIQCFLKDADAKAEAVGSDGVKVWVNQVRLVAFQIEDVIDEYTLHLAQSRGFTAYLLPKNFVCFFVKLKTRHQVGRQLKEIKESVCSIKERSARYGFDSIYHDDRQAPQKPEWYDPRITSVFLKEAEVVGIESARDELIGRLVDKSPRRTVISVVGMGGLGKTTLAKKVHDRVIAEFDYHAWIVVSQSYNKEELLKNLLKRLIGQTRMETTSLPKIDEMDEVTLVSNIRDVLQGKRYVVFFDDVWKLEFWGDIEHALVDNKKGGKIVITTRNMDVANFCKRSSHVHVHELQPLPSEMAWELFRTKTFQLEFGGLCPPELEDLSRKIVERCKGLPLAIVAIAGLLSTKSKTINEWRKLHDNLSSELESNPHLTSITKILFLSYNDMPYYLKSCFLYFGMYPEDYSIPCSRLIRQWLCEGFISPVHKDKTLEIVAQEYLTELIHRSLVQVSKSDFNGKIKECCVHDLLHEMIVKKMEELNFGQILSGYESSFTEPIRRISIVKSSATCTILKSGGNSRVRDILIFSPYDKIPKFPNTKFCLKFKLLKVLDFEGSLGLNNVSKHIGNLFHLKYLSLAKTNVMLLPRPIGNLQNLETLNLKDSLVYELPVEINGLHKLRHLLVSRRQEQTHTFPVYENEGVKVQKGIGRLTCLQKLYKVKGIGIMEDLKKLTQLRKLVIYELKVGDAKSLCESINEMKHLESLCLLSDSVYSYIDLESLSSPPEYLQRLFLSAPLGKLPGWIKKLRNLVKLEIRHLGFVNDPLEVFQNLHNLTTLSISWNAYMGLKLEFKQGVFPKLKFLALLYLENLNSLVIEEGAMPNLELFFFGPSTKLMEVPSGIQHLRNLKKILFNCMPAEFQNSVRPHGPQHHIVQHVPSLAFEFWGVSERGLSVLKGVDGAMLQARLRARR